VAIVPDALFGDLFELLGFDDLGLLGAFDPLDSDPDLSPNILAIVLMCPSATVI
jgi:hypothetical protein